LYKIVFLVTIAVVSTIPWDSYLIRTGIWSYPPNVIIGPTLFDIPLEEVFFFIIQTFNTTLLYLILSKPVLHPVYLVKEQKGDKWKYVKVIGQVAAALVIKKGVDFVKSGGEKTYLGLIVVWAFPFLFLLWSLGYQLLVQLPPTSTIIPITLPTLYLWIVDTLALKRGTWVIEAGTKTGFTLWPGLEIEEAVFFLLTNILIVFGLVAFDNAVAILDAFPAHFRQSPTLPSPALLVRALLLPASAYDDDRILGLQQSVDRLQKKSRSFFLASGTFNRRLRIDLIILYSFCRVADDLIDNANSSSEAKEWVQKLKMYLDLSYGGFQKTEDGKIILAKDANRGSATLYTVQNFPPDAQLTLLLLPTWRLAKEPLYELLKGFEMDLNFSGKSPSGPIKTENDLDLYGARVAGTVALLCIQLVLHHHPGAPESKAKRLMSAGHDMGIALQYTNIARDLGVDANDGRCYVPPGWLKKEKLTAEGFISGLKSSSQEDFFLKKVETVRSRLLDRAFSFYSDSVGAIEELPRPARAPMRVAVESYMQIGRELQSPGYKVKAGRATVPKWKRIWVAWRTLLGPRSSS
jgi:15-cis-phytoene synthase / lycopene beta-cyclase